MDTLYFRTHEGRRDAAPQATTVKGKDAKIATGAYDALNEASTDLGDTVNLGIIATVSALGYADWRPRATTGATDARLWWTGLRGSANAPT